MKIQLMAAALCGLMITGCSSPSTEKPLDTPIGNWELTEMVGYKLVPDAKASLMLQEDGQLSGSGSCNRYFGQVKIDKEKIEVAPVGMTRMACEENIMNQEDTFIKTLGNVTNWQGKDGNLVLNDANNKALLVFKPSVEPSAQPNTETSIEPSTETGK